MKRFPMVFALALVLTGCGGEGADEVDRETEAIINEWIRAWMAEDVEGVAHLYAEDGIYADAGCPFEMNGRIEIRNMVRGHLRSTDYTTVDPASIEYTDSGAVVSWVWGGTQDGEPFTMQASTAFEIENGVIARSTDSYDLSEAPPGWEAACIAYNG